MSASVWRDGNPHSQVVEVELGADIVEGSLAKFTDVEHVLSKNLEVFTPELFQGFISMVSFTRLT